MTTTRFERVPFSEAFKKGTLVVKRGDAIIDFDALSRMTVQDLAPSGLEDAVRMQLFGRPLSVNTGVKAGTSTWDNNITQVYARYEPDIKRFSERNALEFLKNEYESYMGCMNDRGEVSVFG